MKPNCSLGNGINVAVDLLDELLRARCPLSFGSAWFTYELVVVVEAQLRPMRLVGNVCRFCQAYYHCDSRSVESLDASRGFVDDSKHYEACELYEFAALEKWGEEGDGNWIGNGAGFQFERSHNHSREKKSRYLCKAQDPTVESKVWGQRCGD